MKIIEDALREGVEDIARQMKEEGAYELAEPIHWSWEQLPDRTIRITARALALLRKP